MKMEQRQRYWGESIVAFWLLLDTETDKTTNFYKQPPEWNLSVRPFHRCRVNGKLEFSVETPTSCSGMCVDIKPLLCYAQTKQQQQQQTAI